LEGIERLRGLILNLAIRGKLVEQKKSDESASQLLKRISSEKQKLVEQGKIRKPDTLDSLNDEEKSFHLPTGWEWIRLGDVIEFVNGYAFKSSDYTDSGFGIVKIGDIQNGVINSLEMSRVSSDVVAELDDILQVNSGDLVIAMSGATTGKLGFSKSEETFYLNQRVGKIIPFHVNKDYLFHYLSTKIAENLTISQGSAIPNLSTAQIKNIVLALPPLAEQHRIVAKVEELMALCDELEKQETHHLKSHALLVETLLGTLTQAKDAKEFQQAWKTLAQHFDDLFTTEDSIDQLKQTILQLAVMGKLVPQDPKDEPASVLLERIREEKDRLVEEGKLKIEKPLPPISSNEIRYALPKGWAWCRMWDLGYIGNGSTPDKKEFTNNSGDIPYLKVYNIVNQKVAFDYKPQYILRSCHTTQLKRSICYSGDVLMNIVGPPLGKVAIVPDEIAECNINQAIVVIRPILKELNQWIYWYLCEQSAINSIVTKGTAGQDNISVTQSRSLPIALPPLNEQKRIISKVNELFALCDELKARLAAAQTLANQMAEGVVEQVIAN
jgi:type I restriction enzyme S subunit